MKRIIFTLSSIFSLLFASQAFASPLDHMALNAVADSQLGAIIAGPSVITIHNPYAYTVSAHLDGLYLGTMLPGQSLTTSVPFRSSGLIEIYRGSLLLESSVVSLLRGPTRIYLNRGPARLRRSAPIRRAWVTRAPSRAVRAPSRAVRGRAATSSHRGPRSAQSRRR